VVFVFLFFSQLVRAARVVWVLVGELRLVQNGLRHLLLLFRSGWVDSNLLVLLAMSLQVVDFAEVRMGAVLVGLLLEVLDLGENCHFGLFGLPLSLPLSLLHRNTCKGLRQVAIRFVFVGHRDLLVYEVTIALIQFVAFSQLLLLLRAGGVLLVDKL